jgi:hypothetical protein
VAGTYQRRRPEETTLYGTLAHNWRAFLATMEAETDGTGLLRFGRRMSERAAHLVDSVLPRVPVRQWVLTVPYGLRYRMAHDPALTTKVLNVFVRAVAGWLKRRARRLGIAGSLKTLSRH